jgi:uncharacterized protein (DUF2236 family)
VTAVTYGAIPEVESAVAQVQRVHKRVAGVSSRGVPYDATDPGFSAWVHNALTDSFLVAHQTFGRARLTPAEADPFVREQRRAGELLEANPMPSTASGLGRWLAGHPGIGPSQEMTEAVAFLIDPPLDTGLRIGYAVLRDAAIATIPERIRAVLELEPRRGAIVAGRATIAGLHWALGYSPSWELALRRVGAPVPEGLFRQAPRVS